MALHHLHNGGPDALIDQDGVLWEAGTGRDVETDRRRTADPAVRFAVAAVDRGALTDLGEVSVPEPHDEESP